MIDMTKPILLVGNVLVDVFTLPGDSEKRLRLGGIAHAARTLWGLGVDYHVAYIAPIYLHDNIEDYFKKHGVNCICCAAEVFGSPNIALIGDPTEAGDQRYELLLREIKKVVLKSAILEKFISDCEFKDILFFPEITDPPELISILSKNKTSTLHIDANNIPDLIDSKGFHGQIKVGSLFLSTSSCFFYPEFKGLSRLLGNVFSFCEELILKENRGGTRAFGKKGDITLSIPCFPRAIMHSVGVGDGFDATYLALKKEDLDEYALRLSSIVAASYAATTFVDDMKDDMQLCLGMSRKDVLCMKGQCLPWEDRKKINIYIAAPDFDYVEKPELAYLVDCLKYHNFFPRLPIRENGQASESDNIFEKRRLFDADIRIMDECSLMIAILLYNDQGTLVEIGMAKSKGMPVIVYDPRKIINNLFLEILPDKVTSDAEETISTVFSILGGRKFGV